MKKIGKHLPHYLSLISILIAGAGIFIFFPHDRPLQIAATVAMAIGYVTWGIIHHLVHRDLTLSVLIEYFVFALFGSIVIFYIIFRA